MKKRCDNCKHFRASAKYSGRGSCTLHWRWKKIGEKCKDFEERTNDDENTVSTANFGRAGAIRGR